MHLRSSLLFGGHHTCPLKLKVWLSPSCLGTYLSFSLETIKWALLNLKLVFQEQTRSQKRCDGLIVCYCHLWLSLKGQFQSQSTCWMCPIVPLSPACCWRFSSLLLAWGFFLEEAKHGQGRNTRAQISSWCRLGAQLGWAELPTACTFLPCPVCEAHFQRKIPRCQKCSGKINCGSPDVF